MWSLVENLAVFTLSARAPCPGSILRRAPMWTHLFSWYPRQNSGTVPVPEYKVSTLYSGTKLGTESLCEHIFRWCPGTLPTNHLFSYPQFLVPLEISIVSVCSVYWVWTYLRTGYRVSEHSTILCRCPSTSARAPSVNTAFDFTHGTAHVLSGNSRRTLAICYGKITSFP